MEELKDIKLECNIRINNLIIETNIEHWNNAPDDVRIEYFKEKIKEYFEDYNDEIITQIIEQNKMLINKNL